MFSLFFRRAVPRAFAPAAATAALRPATLARQHLVARTFLTTALASEPAAKSTTTKAKSTATTATKHHVRSSRGLSEPESMTTTRLRAILHEDDSRSITGAKRES